MDATASDVLRGEFVAERDFGTMVPTADQWAGYAFCESNGAFMDGEGQRGHLIEEIGGLPCDPW